MSEQHKKHKTKKERSICHSERLKKTEESERKKDNTFDITMKDPVGVKVNET